MAAPIRPDRVRATFRGYRLTSPGMDQVLAGEYLIELRRLSPVSQLYGIYWLQTGTRAMRLGFPLREAKVTAESLFVERITEWEEFRT